MVDLDAIPVRHVPTRERTGALNMALDAVAAEQAAVEGIATVRVYEWDPSTLSLGYSQDPETIDWSYCEDNGIHVTRRPTGGGAIYHDNVGDISYSIVVPSEQVPDNLLDSYHALCEPILTAFERVGVSVEFADSGRDEIHRPACYLRELNPSHDLVVQSEQGLQKVSGNAQYRRRSAVVQHGSLTYRSTPERHVGCFSASDLNPETFSDHVTGIASMRDIARADVVEILEETLRDWADAKSGEFSEAEHQRAAELVDLKFGASAWIHDRTDPLQEA